MRDSPSALKRELLSQLRELKIDGIPRNWFENKSTDSIDVCNDTENDVPSVRAKNVVADPVPAVIDEGAIKIMGSSWDEVEAMASTCRRCRLCETRNKVVFGDGNIARPRIVFVGEGPGAEEDKQGKPFVGRAGELLTNAITKGMGLTREEVYICNVVKCRPPENRTPLPDEVASCSPYLFRQLEILSPEVIVTLGAPAQKTIVGLEQGITKIRGTWQSWRGIKVMPTLHPAYLLRNPPAKKDFWSDLQLVMAALGIKKQ